MPSTGDTYEQQLRAVLEDVAPTDPADEDAAWTRLDSLTKPPRSLGRVEGIAATMARIQRDVRPSVERKAVIVMAGDHGVVAQGVSPYPQEVTWQMVANFAAGGAAINQFARSVGADVIVYDVGVASDTSGFEGVVQRKVMAGTRDLSLGPAMTREECAHAVLVGVEAARDLAQAGYRVLAIGEMGIGNTTPASALTCALTGASPEDVVGPGTGLDARGVDHKAQVVRAALEVNDARSLDAFGVLASLGGLEIAALAGVVLGAAQERVAVVVDGFISSAATLAAVALCPDARDYLIVSHRSAEPGHSIVLDHLEAQPVLELDMRLGEGTGAALVMGIVDAACRMLSGMATFAEAGVSERDR